MRKKLAALLLVAACHHVRTVPTGPLSRTAYAHYFAGKMALYGDDPVRAAAELAAAAAAAPDQPMISIDLARALAKAKRDRDARDVLAKTRRAWPDHPQVWLASGEVLEEVARAQDKNSPQSTHRATESAQNAALRAEAAGAYRRAIGLEPTEERGYVGLARLQLAGNDARGAERTLRSLVGKVPASVDGHYLLAQRLAARGDLSGAASELRVVIERDPDHLDARLDLARALRKLGKLPEAIAQTRSAFDRAGEPIDIAEELFYLLGEADDRQGALDLLTLLDDDRSDPEALVVIARLDIGLGRLEAAETIVGRVAPESPDLAMLVTIALDVARRDAAHAREHAAAVPPSSTAFGDAQRLLAEAEIQADNGAAAAAALAAAKADMGALTIAKARLQLLHKSPAGALALLEPWIREHPDHVSALNLAGYVLADTRQRLGDADRYLRHARELAPGDPAVLDSWGWLLVARGDRRAGIAALDHAARYAPREAEILYHLAAAWAADRNPRTASEILDRATALQPPADVQRRIDVLRDTLKP